MTRKIYSDKELLELQSKIEEARRQVAEAEEALVEASKHSVFSETWPKRMVLCVEADEWQGHNFYLDVCGFEKNSSEYRRCKHIGGDMELYIDVDRYGNTNIVGLVPSDGDGGTRLGDTNFLSKAQILAGISDPFNGKGSIEGVIAPGWGS